MQPNRSPATAHTVSQQPPVRHFDDDTVFERSQAPEATGRVNFCRRLVLLLELVNDRRTMAEYRDLLPRHRDLDGDLGALHEAGLIRIRQHPVAVRVPRATPSQLGCDAG